VVTEGRKRETSMWGREEKGDGGLEGEQEERATEDWRERGRKAK
jgi:hypothetical protein